VLDQEVTLFPYGGVDFDRAPASPGRVDGPDGNVDLYFNSTMLLVNGGNLFGLAGGGTRDACENTVAARANKSSMAFAVRGLEYCFRTSSGRLAWIRINDTRGYGAGERIVLDARVW
jgi:hypothetical protein